MFRMTYALVFLLGCTTFAFAQTEGQARVDFNRDVRPLLVDKCFACHGPDAETVAGGLRLDSREAAIDAGAIVPGKPQESPLISRIQAEDPELLMPPIESHKELGIDERETLNRWIAEGAVYQRHWAYTRLEQPALPEFNDLPNGHWARTYSDHPIDRWVAAKLVSHSLLPSRRADRVTLIRRLTYDLTGLPPTPEEVRAFLEDDNPDAYERLVDRLLDSPRFGERMAIYWLDLVRYADTVGYHGDQDVSQSPYRDYVIDSFNNNKPYDEFVREQLAGDLLPDATLQQKVASGYNRLNQTTEEGGAQPKEYLAIYFADRVRNVSQVFLGATMGCAQCHDHKFDPYTQRDFYSFGAFFADIQEVGLYGARKRPPMIPVPTQEQSQQMKKLAKELEHEEKELLRLTQLAVERQSEWERETAAEKRSAPTLTELT